MRCALRAIPTLRAEAIGIDRRRVQLARLHDRRRLRRDSPARCSPSSRAASFPRRWPSPSRSTALVMVLLGGVETVSGADRRARSSTRRSSIWLVSDTDIRSSCSARVIVAIVVLVSQGHRRLSVRLRGARGRRAGRRRPEPMSALLEVRGLPKSYGGVAAVRRRQLRGAGGRDRRLDRSERRGQEHLLQHDQRPDSAPTPARSGFSAAATTGLPPRAVWRLGVGRTFQITATFASMTVAENVQIALLSHRRQLSTVL